MARAFRSKGRGFGKYVRAVSLLAVSVAGCNAGTGSVPSDLPTVEPFASGGDDRLTLALKFVSYTDETGTPVLGEQEVIRVTRGMNELLRVCNMQFRVEKFEAVSAENLGLDFNTASMGEMERIRSSFDDPNYLVVVNTGSWSMGGAANAWTAMPGMVPSGAVIEGPASNDAPLVAHELGHYLNLDHSGDPANMMSPTIYDTSTYISRGQCEEMRQTALSVRSAALRT